MASGKLLSTFVRSTSRMELTLSPRQNIHCIGDRANKIILDIYEDIIQGGGNVTEWRPRIEHAQIMQLSDLERAGKLGGSLLTYC